VARAVEVPSIDAEDELLGCCECGGKWLVRAEDVAPIRNHWYDALVVACSRCGRCRRAVFDVTAFFSPPTYAWVRVVR
jgi:hypothetical protein